MILLAVPWTTFWRPELSHYIEQFENSPTIHNSKNHQIISMHNFRP